MKKRFCSILLTGVLAITSFCIFCNDSYASGYSVNNAIKYAHNWSNEHVAGNTDKYNTGQYLTINDDCTNFVSQCIVAGGKTMTNVKQPGFSLVDYIRGYKCSYTNKQWYHKKTKIKKIGKKKTVFYYSSSFSFVGDFYDYWKSQPGCKTFGDYDSCKKNSKLQKNIQLGDVIQMYDKGQGWHHTMIITAGKKGDWKFCSHTTSHKDKPLSSLETRNRKFRIIRIR